MREKAVLQFGQQARLFSLLAALVFTLRAPVFGQGFPCNGESYLAMTPSRQFNSRIVKLAFANGQMRFDTIVRDAGTKILALAHSPYDNHLYGLTAPARKLVRINALGQITELADLSGRLSPGLSYSAGCSAPNGRRMVLVGHDSTLGIDREILTIRLDNPNFGINKASVLSAQGVHIDDMAFSPTYGILFGYDKRAHQMVEISLTGQVTPRGQQMQGALGGLGALFFNQQGELFGYGRSPGADQDNGLYQIDFLQGRAIRLTEGPRVVISEGCSCPYSIQFEKTYSDQVAAPCTETTLTYRVRNQAGFSYEFIDIRDTLPPGFTVAGIERFPVGSVLLPGSQGSGVVALRVSDLLLGINEFRIRVDIGQVNAGPYASQAWMGAFPFGLGGNLPSDDPSTLARPDPTVLFVGGVQLRAEESSLTLCPGQSLTLVATGSGPFWWQDGPGPSRRTISETGWYWVEVLTPCGAFRDSLFVIGPRSAPIADLGLNQSVDLGEPLLISPVVAGEGPLQLSWAYSGGVIGLCAQCEEPDFVPLSSGVLSLQVSDRFGCLAKDSIDVTVDAEVLVMAPNVFSPNGDGANDWFYFYGKAPGRVLWAQVFDRWGRLVWSAAGLPLNVPDRGWDGSAQGKSLKEAVYFYAAEIELIDGRKIPLNGYVTLIR